MTLMYQVSLGTWGTPSSTIKAWVGLDGQPLRLWINEANFELNRTSATDNKFIQVDLLNYMTSKNPALTWNVAHSWYDELIISSQPIAAPGGGAVDAPVVNPPATVAAPAPPTGVQFKSN